MLSYKHRLPWITNSLRRFINKKHKLYKKRNDTKYSNAYKKIKTQVQKEQREIGTTLNQSSVIYQ